MDNTCNFLYFFSWFPNGLLTKTNCFSHIIHHNNTRIGKENLRQKNPKFWTFAGHPRRGVRLVLLDPQHIHDTQSSQVCPQNHHFTGLLCMEERRVGQNCVTCVNQMQLVFPHPKHKILHVFCSLHVGREVAHPGVITSAHDQVLNFEFWSTNTNTNTNFVLITFSHFQCRRTRGDMWRIINGSASRSSSRWEEDHHGLFR